ncbi:MAG: ribosome maturation factor RimM [Notoacmeibacter sp.]
MSKKTNMMVVMAKIGRAHGLKGEVHAQSFTSDPLALTDYGDLTDANGRVFKIAALREQGSGLVLRLQGITTREAAEALNGVELLLSRDALPETDDEDDFYYADLIGLGAVTINNEALGKVLAVHNFGAGDMLELRLVSGKSVFVPFTKAAVPTVSIQAGTVTIDEEAAGLLSDDAPEPGEDQKQ